MTNKKIAVILSGCGSLDGAEISESVITLLELDKNNVQYNIFAPDIEFIAIDHLTTSASGKNRNVLVEAARIARGKIKTIEKLNHKEYDALILPGGFGVAKNFSNIANDAQEKKILNSIEQIILAFWQHSKPIGAICIAPALVTLALKNKTQVNVTLGDKTNSKMIENFGGYHTECNTEEVNIDKENKIYSCSAYMREDRISKVAKGIEKLVKEILKELISDN